MNLETIKIKALEVLDILLNWLQSPQFYVQVGSAIAAIIIASFASKALQRKVPFFKEPPKEGPMLLARDILYQLKDLLFPILCVLLLSIASNISLATVEQAWLIKIAQSLAVIFLLYVIVMRFIKTPFINALFKWVGIPIATLHVFGWLDDVTQFLDGAAFEVGNIRLSALLLARALIFGSILFWLGRMSNNAGQKVIRNQEALDTGTKEVFAKLFEMLLFFGIFMILLQIMGINLTALAVFGGALGVGLGFGLQQIAANFISGIIILLDRSLTIGDYVELEDGRTGTITALNMRSTTLETYDGKDIVVPNEQFIVTSFTNWTHKDPTQRYEVQFAVSYDTDITQLSDLLIPEIEKHPKVLDEPEPVGLELQEFGESGIVFIIEYWIDGIDDGENNIASDLMFTIWQTLKDNNIKMPYPQREVRIVNPEALSN